MSEEEDDDRDPVMLAFREGRNLSDEEAAQAELAFQSDPRSLPSLARFLGHRFGRSVGRFMSEPSVAAHVHWLIENHPGSPLTRIVGTHPFPVEYDLYTSMRVLWLRSMDAHPSDPAVLLNAAIFFQFMEKSRARATVERVLVLRPGDAKASEQLVHLTMLEATDWSRSGDDGEGPRIPTTNPERAKDSVRVLEQALASCPDERKSSTLLVNLVRTASASQDWEKVGRYAQRLLEISSKRDDLGWMHGNALYYGNSGLGLAALHGGDREEAKRRLRAAGKTKGSPQLGSFGPNVTLAAELLRAGERDAVLEFFESCRGFWKMGGAQLDGWKSAVLAGRWPDFGANLVY